MSMLGNWIWFAFAYFWAGAFVTGAVTVLIASNKAFRQIKSLIIVILIICFVFLWPIGILAVYLSMKGGESTEADKEGGSVPQAGGVRIAGIITTHDGKIKINRMH